MNKYFSLTRVQLKTGIDPLATGKYSGFKGAGILLLICIGMVPFVSGLILATSSLYRIYSPVGQEGIILALATGIVSMLTFVFGIFFIFNVYYFNSDTEHLLSLPLRPAHILGAKLTVTLLFEYLSELIFLLPVLITYGIKSSAGFSYYLISLLIFLVLPVIPLVMASVFTLFIMRFSNILKNKDIVRIIVAVAGISIMIGFNFYIQNNINSKTSGAQIIELLNKGNNSLVPVISAIFPANGFASAALVQSGTIAGFSNLVLFILISSLSVIVFLYLGELLYLKGVVGNFQSTSRKETGTSDIKTSVKQNSILYTLTIKELKLLFRTPAWFFNCVIGTFIWPVLLLIFTYQANELKYENLKYFISGSADSGMLPAVMTAAAIMVTSMNGAASSSISREGSSILFSKYIPVRFSTQLLSKILSGSILGLTGFAALILVASYKFNVSIFHLLAGSIISIPAILSASAAGVLFDLISPKLIWDNEYKPVKQNFNVIFNMVSGAAVSALMIYVTNKFNLSISQFFFAALLFFSALCMLYYRILSGYASRRFSRLNV